MIALHESLVDWTALALGIAVAAALLVRMRRPLGWSRYWLPGVALAVIVANAGIALNAAAAAASAQQQAGSAASAVGIGAVASLACLVVLLMAWLYLNPRLRVLPGAPPSARDAEDDCCGECPECRESGKNAVATADMAPLENPGRKRARGLTMTRLGGG